MRKVSIVMTYYNRPNQLRRTLETISLSALKSEVEVIVVDDGSDEDMKASSVLVSEEYQKGGKLNYRCLYIPSEKKTWINPCHAFNLGFGMAEGEVVIIQNAECFHAGDLISYAFRETKDRYLVYSCKNLKKPGYERFNNMVTGSKEFHTKVNQLKLEISKWYNHPRYNPRGLHFTSSIRKKNLDALGGFDERYAEGYCFDDNEFISRIKRSPFEVILVPPDDIFSIHQWHDSTLPKLGNQDPRWKRNSRLFSTVTLKETGWRANQ